MKREQIVLPCIRAVVGDWVYYSTVMTAKQINDWVIPVKSIRESKELDDRLQRDLRDEKKRSIAKYLLQDNTHFFNSIIVGIFDGVPDWIALSYSSEYKGDKVFDEEDKTYLSESTGIMRFNGEEKMFALDGQHRVEGIKLAFEEGLKNPSEMEKIKDDQYSILFVGHIDDFLGKKRSRKLFSDINKNAKPVVLSDKIKIDEQDIAAIVTRRIFANYKYFKNKKIISLDEQSSLKENDVVHFTNLTTLYYVSRTLKATYKKEKGTHEWDEINIKTLCKNVEAFFDFVIANIEEYDLYFNKKELTLQKARNNNSYFLFRPIGLQFLSKLYVKFYRELEYLRDNINKVGFIMPNSPLNNIVWSQGKMEAKSKNVNLAFELVCYLLNRYDENLEDLRKKYIEVTKKPPRTRLPKKLLK